MNQPIKKLIFLAPLVLVAQVLVFGTEGVNRHLGMGLAHMFLVYVGVTFVQPKSNWLFVFYFAGYIVIFGLTAGYHHKSLLLILLAMFYAATFHSPLLFGYFIIYFLSYVVFPLYSFAEFLTGILLYSGIYTMARTRQGKFVSASFVWGSLLIVLLLVPLLHLLGQTSPQDIPRVFGDDDIRASIWLSVQTSTIATLIIGIFGIPLAYSLSRTDFAGKAFLVTLLDVPILVPQPIVALALLPFFGENASLGLWLGETFNVQFMGALAGIVAAQVFVSSPFLIRSALAAFEEVDPRMERVARTLGASAPSAFWLVALPLASRGILAGIILAWSRSISEFGSVYILAPYPETAPVMIYNLFSEHGIGHQTLPAVALLVLSCIWIFVGLHFIRSFWGIGGSRVGSIHAD